jgi:PPOX class probable F420-dependent enzyme
VLELAYADRVELDAPLVAFIERQRVARLATVDGAGRPHVVPVVFALLEGRVYTPVDEKPKRTARLQRLRNIEANPSVAVLFDEYDEDWSRLGWVMLRGHASVLEGGEERARAIAALRARYPQHREMRLEERPVIRIEPQRVNAWGRLDPRDRS